MSRNSYWDARVKCPFYRERKNNFLSCEGITDRGNVLIRFSKESHIKKYMEEYCSDIQKCSDCFIHKALTQRWEETQEQ